LLALAHGNSYTLSRSLTFNGAEATLSDEKTNSLRLHQQLLSMRHQQFVANSYQPMAFSVAPHLPAASADPSPGAISSKTASTVTSNIGGSDLVIRTLKSELESLQRKQMGLSVEADPRSPFNDSDDDEDKNGEEEEEERKGQEEPNVSNNTFATSKVETFNSNPSSANNASISKKATQKITNAALSSASSSTPSPASASSTAPANSSPEMDKLSRTELVAENDHLKKLLEKNRAELKTERLHLAKALRLIDRLRARLKNKESAAESRSHKASPSHHHLSAHSLSGFYGAFQSPAKTSPNGNRWK